MGTFTTPSDDTFDLEINGITRIAYYAVGGTQPYRDLIGSQITCSGGTMNIKGQTIHNMVQHVEVRITIEQEGFTAHRDGRLMARGNAVLLPCGYETRGCPVHDGAYIWSTDQQYCDMALARDTHGVEVTGENGDTMYLAQDGSLIRLTVGEAQIACGGHIVYSTNYPDIYLYRPTTTFHFKKGVHPVELKMAAYTASIAEGMYETIDAAITRAFNEVLYDACKERRANAKHRYWTQIKDSGFTSYLLGNGTFAKSNGETLYRYQCRERLVKAISAHRCYSALPVQLLDALPGDEERWQSRAQDSRDSTEEAPPAVFLEPLTRRLTTVGVPQPCSDRFSAKYRSLNGEWIKATPQITQAPAPRELPAASAVIPEDFFPEVNWTYVGLYPGKVVDEMRVYLEFERAKQNVPAQFSTQMGDRLLRNSYGPADIFPQSPYLQVLTQSSFWKRVWTFFHQYGEAASVLVATYMVLVAFRALAGWLLKAFYILRIHGCGPRLLWGMLPTLYLFWRQWKEANQRRKERQTQQEMERLRHYHQVPSGEPGDDSPPGPKPTEWPDWPGKDSVIMQQLLFNALEDVQQRQRRFVRERIRDSLISEEPRCITRAADDSDIGRRAGPLSSATMYPQLATDLQIQAWMDNVNRGLYGGAKEETATVNPARHRRTASAAQMPPAMPPMTPRVPRPSILRKPQASPQMGGPGSSFQAVPAMAPGTAPPPGAASAPPSEPNLPPPTQSMLDLTRAASTTSTNIAPR